MTLARTICFLLATVLAATAAGAGETVIQRDILGPEGPLYIEGNLYFVAWGSGTLSKWDGTKTVVLNNAKGCSHNGLAFTRQRTFLLACTDYHGAILELDMTGKQLRRWDADSAGRKFDGGINDIVTTANGGAYATIFGLFADRPGAVIGRVLYRAPGKGSWATVADNINYANGVGVSPDQKTLYVSEMVGNCILKFAIQPDGSLGQRSNFALLNLLVRNKVESWWLGPDSMKIDKKGNLYVAQWSGGKILKIAPTGRLLHVFEIAAGDGTTNVAFAPGEKELYVTVVHNPNDPRSVGEIVRIANVE